MRREDLKVLLIKIVDFLPIKLQKTIFRTIIETRYLIHKLRFLYSANRNIANPTKVYWISPNRVTKCLSPENRKGFFNSEKNRGKIVGGDWDKTEYDFVNTIDVYEAFRKRIHQKIEWRETGYYKRILKQIESGNFIYGLKNETDLNERCKYLDSLYEDIKSEGYRLNRNIHKKNITFGEIDVNIGRNGEYIFRDGIHRLSIAKILGLKIIPVTVFARHKKWQEFRNFLFSHAKHLSGRLYQPPVHPDLLDIPHNKKYEDLWKTIKLHLGKKNGSVLDIGANMGFWCHKFEDLGYDCYAIEHDPSLCEIMERIRISENKNFKIVNKSIFDVGQLFDRKFDVVLALNIFHHFLKTKTSYFQLICLLENLDTDELFFESHMYGELQMKSAYRNLTETDFVTFLLEHTSLSKSEMIYAPQKGRRVFKLSR